jgi:hypothetical protein
MSQQLDAALADACHDLDAWVADGRPLAEADTAFQSNQMKIGDWFAFGQERFGKKRAYDEGLKLFHNYKRPTLREFAHVARSVPALVRTNDLSFAHHKLVARFKNPEYQKQLLTHAVDNRLGKEALRAYINELHPPAAPKKRPTVSIEDDQRAAIDELTMKYNQPFNAVVRLLLSQALEIQNALQEIEVA